jgi:hypothetical protein
VAPGGGSGADRGELNAHFEDCNSGRPVRCSPWWDSVRGQYFDDRPGGLEYDNHDECNDHNDHDNSGEYDGNDACAEEAQEAQERELDVFEQRGFGQYGSACEQRDDATEVICTCDLHGIEPDMG